MDSELRRVVKVTLIVVALVVAFYVIATLLAVFAGHAHHSGI
jgi:hypothetical protein